MYELHRMTPHYVLIYIYHYLLQQMAKALKILLTAPKASYIYSGCNILHFTASDVLPNN